MAKKMNFRNDMKEAKMPEVNAEDTERLPTEKGYTRTKRKLKGTKNNEQTLRHGKKPIEKKQSGKLKSAVVSQQLHRKIAEADEDDNIGVESVNRGVQAAEAGADVARGTVQKIKKYGNKLHDRAVKPEINAEKETLRHVEEEFSEGVKTAATAKTTGAAAESAGKSNPLSRFMQRKNIKQDYAAAKAGRAVSSPAAYGHAVKTPLKERVSQVFSRAGEFVKSHAGVIAIGGAFIFLLVFMFTQLSSCSSMAGGSGGTLLGSSYTAEDADIIGANEDYKALEAELRSEIDNIESTHPGYDEYRYQIDEIYHNPYQLISYFTAKYGAFTYDQVKDEVEEIFREQYGIDITGEKTTVTETKEVGVGESLGSVVTSGYCNCPICCGIWSGGPTASGAYPTANHTIAVDASHPFVPMGTKVIMNGVEYTVEDTGAFDRYGVQFDVYYDSHAAASAHGHQTWEAYLADDNSSKTVEVTTARKIRRLSTVMTGSSLDQILRARMNEDQIQQYELYNATYGNRQDLFDVAALQIPDGMSYKIPPEALSDERFKRMITEAEKYLGYPYVWGGASPSTSFDCSGFVSWVINHSGNGWNYGRLTAEGLRNACTYVPPSEAKPGDLVFFQGTYDTAGASHVGIYVGNGMMIHCGNPIQYASIETSYWQQHFYCFGRLP